MIRGTIYFTQIIKLDNKKPAKKAGFLKNQSDYRRLPTDLHFDLHRLTCQIEKLVFLLASSSPMQYFHPSKYSSHAHLNPKYHLQPQNELAWEKNSFWGEYWFHNPLGQAAFEGGRVSSRDGFFGLISDQGEGSRDAGLGVACGEEYSHEFCWRAASR